MTRVRWVAVALIAAIAGVLAPAAAELRWRREGPRRDGVDGRIGRQPMGVRAPRIDRIRAAGL